MTMKIYNWCSLRLVGFTSGLIFLSWLVGRDLDIISIVGFSITYIVCLNLVDRFCPTNLEGLKKD